MVRLNFTKTSQSQDSSTNEKKTPYEITSEEVELQNSSVLEPVEGDVESGKESRIESNDLKQGLESRHIQLIALGGSIGTGLFVGTGSALSSCGPAGLLTAYLIMSTIIYFVMNQLGEMTCFLPSKGGAISNLVDRYVDESLRFATGWIYYYTYVILLCSEVTAASIVVEYWTKKVPVGVWITIFLVIVVLLNFLAVKFYGEAEFWFASIKIFCIVGLIIVGIVIFFGGAPKSNGVLGFHYWKHPGAFAIHLAHGNTGKFLDVWTGVIKSGFAFIVGPELVAIAASETQNPRRNIAKASRRFVYRLMFFYIMGSLVIGVIVSYKNSNLMNGSSNASASPFVIGIQEAGIKVLNHIVNACILTSAWSSGNSFFYAASRFLLSMSKAGDAPKIFRHVNRFGVPYYACAITAAFSCLAYLNVSDSSSKVFTWFSNISTISGFVGWIIIGITYTRFRKAVYYNNLQDRMPFVTPLEPYGAYYTIFMISIICITNGYAVFFENPFPGSDFVAAYITLPFFWLLYFGHKIFTRNWKLCYKVEEIDVFTGLDEAEREEQDFKEKYVPPSTIIGKFWEWLM